jgi:hypothetical protein
LTTTKTVAGQTRDAENGADGQPWYKGDRVLNAMNFLGFFRFSCRNISKNKRDICRGATSSTVLQSTVTCQLRGLLATA